MDFTLWMCLKVTPFACHLWIQRGKIPPHHISEQIHMEANGERRVIFRSHVNRAMNHTYGVCRFRKSFFNLKKVVVCYKTNKVQDRTSIVRQHS